MLKKIIFLWIFCLSNYNTSADWTCSKGKFYCKNSQVVFIYIHGLGGRKSNSQFVINLKSFFNRHNLTQFKIESYKWNSPKIYWKIAGAKFLEGKEKAEREARIFSLSVISWYERQKIPYYIIAHSMGTYVIAKAFEYQRHPLQMLRGVFFLGSSMPKNYLINHKALPDGLKIINYYSLYHDRVLPLLYNLQAMKSGGQIGFDDVKLFQNFRTTCSHSYKKAIFGLHRDYSTLAEAIGYIASLKEKIIINGSKFKLNTQQIRKQFFSLFWHDLFELRGFINAEEQNILIQQHWNTLDYRIVYKNYDNNYYQLANGRSLHAMLKALDLLN